MVKSFCGLATAFLPVNTQLSWHKTKGMPRYVWDVEYVVIYNGNKTEWSPIRAVIIRVIKKFGRARSGSPICSSRVWLQTELTTGVRVNYNHFDFRKQKYTKNKYLRWKQCLLFKIPLLWKFPSFSLDKWFFAVVIVIISLIGGWAEWT